LNSLYVLTWLSVQLLLGLSKRIELLLLICVIIVVMSYVFFVAIRAVLVSRLLMVSDCYNLLLSRLSFIRRVLPLQRLL
jgi:hypothetical protein